LEHDKLATRLSLIIYKLNQGERLTIESLANEFGVSKRTIERDIARFSYFDIKKEGKEFFWPPLHKGTKCDMRFKSSLNSARLNLLNPYK